MNTTRREAVKMISAMAASCALPASTMNVMRKERTAQLAERLYRSTLYWACSWFDPLTTPVEVLMPRKIAEDSGCVVCELETELKKYCKNSTITLTDADELNIVYVVAGHKVKARFFEPYCLAWRMIDCQNHLIEFGERT